MTIACDGHMLLCECDNKTVKVPSPDGTVTLQSLIAQNCDKSHSFALRYKDMFFVCMANFVTEFNNEGEFLYDIGTGGEGGWLVSWTVLLDSQLTSMTT